MKPSRRLRCAIYTRVSTKHGLEQEFNSLDAQREAAEAYVKSQAHEGWIGLKDRFDDGGYSGGSMERPALQNLLAAVKARRIDVIVVYKVDRLTRSLADFAKLVELFDTHGVSFVSVTQSFNTTSSMRRLTLNVLLSFAQFEREVTGERIREKIAASKKKGLWMGGIVLQGYEARERKLVVNEQDAEMVRHIFRRYAALRSVNALRDDLDATSNVVALGGNEPEEAPHSAVPARGALYRMLQNRISRGEIVHKGKCYSGQHEAIIDEALWNEVQEALAQKYRVDRASRSRATSPSLLAGLVHDESGDRMSPTHANKKGTRYRYYVSQALITGSRQKTLTAACRVPAADLESIIADRLCAFLRDGSAIFDAIGAGQRDIVASSAVIT